MIDLNKLPHSTHTITNRHGLEVFTRFNGTDAKRPLAVIAHGLSDVHDSSTLRAMTSGLIETGYNVLVWDATHSWGRSGGTLREATLTAAYEDLCDVVAWARTQPWFHGTFVLGGHSLGAAAALMYATEQPEAVERLLLVSPLVAGKLAAKQINPAVRLLWRLTGRLPHPSSWRTFFGYNLLRDGLRYDGRLLASNVQVPTVIVVGAGDRVTPSDTARLLFDELPPEYRHFMIVPAANHGFDDDLDKLETTIKAAIWLV